MKITALFLLPVLMFSCAYAVVGAAGAAGGYVFVRGQLKDDVGFPLSKVQNACLAAFRDLGFHTTRNRSDVLSGKIKAEMADGTTITIWLKSQETGMTRIRLRIGFLGDRDLSVKVLDTIKKHL